MNIPNALTVSRLLLIPVLVVVFYSGAPWAAVASATVFAVASATDWLDGYLARRWGQTTPFGAFLDPVADKVIVGAALVMLVEAHHSVWFTLPAIIIVSREIVISALREWMAELGKRTSVAVSYIGKIKTGFQMVSITAFLALGDHFEGTAYWLSYLMLYAAAGLTLWSMIVYLRAAWPELTAHKA